MFSRPARALCGPVDRTLFAGVIIAHQIGAWKSFLTGFRVVNGVMKSVLCGFMAHRGGWTMRASGAR